MSDLVEIDSLTALVIIDNEIDIMSTIAPGTVEVSGQLAQIAMGSKHHVSGRGDATKEISLEDICCGAWGLSVLLVSKFLNGGANTERADCDERECEAHNALRYRSRTRCMGAQCQKTRARSVFN
jgi:hypothetical protein